MRDCEKCKHYVEKVEVGKGSSPEHYFGCDSWECEFEPKGMSREEAIKHGKEQLEIFGGEHREFIEMAIKALEQEPTTKIEESNFSQEQYLADIQSAYDCGKSVIDKIRAEIQGLRNCSCGCSDGIIDDVEDILDKYKGESEG